MPNDSGMAWIEHDGRMTMLQKLINMLAIMYGEHVYSKDGIDELKDELREAGASRRLIRACDLIAWKRARKHTW